MALYGIRESEAVKKYDAQHPGVQISDAQKVERIERRAVRDVYGARPGVTVRRTKARVGTMTVPPHADIWCDCGRLRGHDGDCKE